MSYELFDCSKHPSGYVGPVGTFAWSRLRDTLESKVKPGGALDEMFNTGATPRLDELEAELRSLKCDDPDGDRLRVWLAKIASKAYRPDIERRGKNDRDISRHRRPAGRVVPHQPDGFARPRTRP